MQDKLYRIYFGHKSTGQPVAFSPNTIIVPFSNRFPFFSTVCITPLNNSDIAYLELLNADIEIVPLNRNSKLWKYKKFKCKDGKDYYVQYPHFMIATGASKVVKKCLDVYLLLQKRKTS